MDRLADFFVGLLFLGCGFLIVAGMVAWLLTLLGKER